jgi:hypothetical protein
MGPRAVVLRKGRVAGAGCPLAETKCQLGVSSLLKYSVAGVFDPGNLADRPASQRPATILQQGVSLPPRRSREREFALAQPRTEY